MADRAILVFDADCGFCRWSVGWLQRWDRRGTVRTVALQDTSAGLLPDMTPSARMASFHLVTPDGVRSAGAALPPLFRSLPGGRPLAALADAFPRTTARLYDAVSRRRGALGRLVGAQRCERATPTEMR